MNAEEHSPSVPVNHSAGWLWARSFWMTMSSPVWLQAGHLLAAIWAISSCEAADIYTLNPAWRTSNLLLSLTHTTHILLQSYKELFTSLCVWRRVSEQHIWNYEEKSSRFISSPQFGKWPAGHWGLLQETMAVIPLFICEVVCLPKVTNQHTPQHSQSHWAELVSG